MNKLFRKLLILTILSSLVFSIIFLMIRLIPESPAQEMKHARECLSDAARSNADTYSSKLYNEAKNNYDSALVNWKKQNQRFIYFRDYERVRMFASMAAQKSIKAKGNSIANTTSLKEQITEKLDTLGELVSELNRLFTAYPLESETRNRISKGKMLLEEAEVAFNRGHYHQSSRNLKDAEYLLSSSYENAYSNLKNYFKSYSKWKTWSEKTIKESKKNGDYSIIIDKFSRKLTVYQKGVKKQEFETELGKNWVGDKRVRGDHATPEGMYKITKKLDSNKTKYYKALLLDYPNEEDLETFKKEVSKGTLPRSAKIGGLIEIHGNGGKGIDWTEGCIALTDREMDVLFKLAKVGTPVTIIGSSQDLAYILKK